MSETIYDGPPTVAELERALVDVAKERDQLLEGIEAHRALMSGDAEDNVSREPSGLPVLSSYMPFDRDLYVLYVLADRIKSKGGDASAPGPDSRNSLRTRATRGDSDQVDEVAPETSQTERLLNENPASGKAEVAYARGFEDGERAGQGKLRELLEWAEATADSYSVAPPSEINKWSVRLYRDLVARIKSSLSSEANS